MNRIHNQLVRPSLPVLILAALADDARYGYALRRRVEQATGVLVPWARLYPLLHRLEADGLVSATWEHDTGRRRKWYRLTEAGHVHLRREAAGWSASIARLEAAILPAVRRSAAHRSPAPSVR